MKSILDHFYLSLPWFSMKSRRASQLFPVMLSDGQLRYSNYIEMDY